tara:strand:- start:4 stop:177 length:174 start_codon:yes stop_codon:yes gene_type:complete
MDIKEYGIRKTWDNKYETYALVKDYGNYLTPITWMREVFFTKKKAEDWLEKKIKELS